MINIAFYNKLKAELLTRNVELVAVSKTKPVADILELYNCGQKVFGENYVQELVEKQAQLPNDIQWHFIGHLQSNKVKYIVPFVSLIQSVDSIKLLKEINKEAKKNSRIIDCLLQIYIAKEETKFGLSFEEARALVEEVSKNPLDNICIKGMMAMASFSNDMVVVSNEFIQLKHYFEKVKAGKQLAQLDLQILCIGMTADYKIAIEQGSNMIRIGSAIFGERVVE
jgi:PLP dependent protein